MDWTGQLFLFREPEFHRGNEFENGFWKNFRPVLKTGFTIQGKVAE
jgi:hypothetical protein